MFYTFSNCSPVGYVYVHFLFTPACDAGKDTKARVGDVLSTSQAGGPAPVTYSVNDQAPSSKLSPGPWHAMGHGAGVTEGLQ